MAWDLKGYCEGTIAPTGSPTSYVNAALLTIPTECTAASTTTVNECYYEKAITTPTPCTCGDSDCPNPTGLAASSTACTKDVVTTSCPSVDLYSSSTKYEAGDVVRIGTSKFVCKPWPYYLWCSQSAYAPSVDAAGIWSDAWSTDGACPT